MTAGFPRACLIGAVPSGWREWCPLVCSGVLRHLLLLLVGRRGLKLRWHLELHGRG